MLPQRCLHPEIKNGTLGSVQEPLIIPTPRPLIHVQSTWFKIGLIILNGKLLRSTCTHRHLDQLHFTPSSYAQTI